LEKQLARIRQKWTPSLLREAFPSTINLPAEDLCVKGKILELGFLLVVFYDGASAAGHSAWRFAHK
jgi:hypothetical protein